MPRKGESLSEAPESAAEGGRGADRRALRDMDLESPTTALATMCHKRSSHRRRLAMCKSAGETARSRHGHGTKLARSRHSHGAPFAPWCGGVEFSPAIDARLVRLVARTADLHSSAATWRSLRRRASRLGASTPCYESVRRLVTRERLRRARLTAAIATLAELATRRIPVLPEEVPRIYARHLARVRPGRPGSRSLRPP
jgi:hypothetical protein